MSLLAFVGGTKPGASASLLHLQTTPDPCGPAIAHPRNLQINVRSGPGTLYQVLAQISVSDLPILGRHHAFAWWQVALPDGTVGWVSDEVVVVSGSVDALPLAEAPEINGYVPDSNEEWVPSSQLPCESTPMPPFSSPALLPTRSARIAAVGVLQSGNDIWAPPLNLSQSGVARNPVPVVAAAGLGHVIWQEEPASGFLYVRGHNSDWSAPVVVELPFGTRRYYPELTEAMATPLFLPQLLADTADRIHALWLDADGFLFHSSVASDDFAVYTAWTARQQVAEDVTAFDATVDTADRLHLTYLSTRDLPGAPAGVYYSRSAADHRSWLAPVLLDSTRYFQAFTAGMANLRTAVGDGESADQVYVTWDNRPLDTIFVTSSADGGQSWGDVTVADRHGPDDSPEAAAPSNTMVATSGDSVLLIWQADHEGTGCRQYYRWSSDGGRTWQGRYLLETLLACYSHGQLFRGGDASILLLAELGDGTYLLAWDHGQWSEPQIQDALTGFVNAETSRPVQLDCYHGQLRNGRLLVVGCSSGEVSDIWITSRDVESTSSWFSPPVWSQPAPVTSDELDVAAVELITTGDGLIHAFITQHQDPAIYYTQWDGTTWSRITPVLRLPDGEAGWPAVASGPGNKLFLIARSSNGSLYFSRANSSDAVTASGWSSPTRLSTAHDGKVSPADIALDAAGTVYIAYSVPVNDERGVYLAKSQDQGESWSEPLQVFDGAAAGFDLVGSPSLSASANDFLHIIWKQQSVPVEGISQPLSLYYARSEDAGRTFSEAENIVETPVAWREMVADGLGNLHQLWQGPDTMTTLWDQVSYDGGHSWQVPQRLPVEAGSVAVTIDTAGRLHLLSVGLGSLGHWFWEGSRWQAGAPLHWSLASQREGPGELLSAASSKDGKMVVVLAVPSGTGDVTEKFLLYAARTLDQPAEQTGTHEAPIQLPVSPTHTPTALPPDGSSTPTTSVASGAASLQSPMDRIEASDPLSQFAMALFPVVLLLLAILGLVALRAVRVKAR